MEDIIVFEEIDRKAQGVIKTLGKSNTMPFLEVEEDQ